MRRFEVRAIIMEDDLELALKKMNDLGAEGWELVQITPPVIVHAGDISLARKCLVYFKREEDA